MPLQTLAEKARQSLGLGSPPFQPISLTRYSQAVGEAGRYAAWLAAVRRELEAGESAVAGLIVSSLATLPDCPLPSLYSERVDSHELTTIPAPPPPPQLAHLFTLPAAAAGAALMRGTQPDAIAAPLPAAAAAVATGPAGHASSTGRNQMHSSSSTASTANDVLGFEGVLSAGQYAELSESMQRLPGQFRAVAQSQFLAPIEVWLQAYKFAQVRLASLDKLRLKVDAARRKLDKKGRAALASITNGNNTDITTTTATPSKQQPGATMGTATTTPTTGNSSVMQVTHVAVSPSGLSASWAEAAVGVAEGGAAGGLVETQQVLQHNLQPLLSEFAAAEQSLSALLTWLVDQAARLRAALAALLLQLATSLEHWQLPQGLLQPLPAAAGGLKGTGVLVSAPAGPLGEGLFTHEDQHHHTHSYAPHPAAVGAAARAQYWLATTPAGPLGEGRLSSEDEDEDQFIYEPHPAAAAARSGRWPASSAEAAAGGRAFQVRPSFVEELQRELSQEGHQLEAESASRQMSMQQHGSDAAIGAIIGSNGGGETASARAGSGSAVAAGNARNGTYVAVQQGQMPGTSVHWAPGVGVVPADRDAAAAAATLAVPVRSSGASSGNAASLNPAAADAAAAAYGAEADPCEPEAALADVFSSAEHSSPAATSAAAGSAAHTRSANQQQQQQQGSPQAGLVKGLWDTALMSYLQRDTALLEGITGDDEACAACVTERPPKHLHSPGSSSLDQECQALLARAAELQAERDTCQAAAAEAAALRDAAAERATQIEAQLRGDLPARRQQLQHEREVLSNQLGELSIKHDSLLQQLAECQGRVAELQQRAAGLQEQEGQVAQLRDEAAASLAQLLPAAAQLAAAREALAGQLAGAEQEVTQHTGRLRHVGQQVSTAAAELASAEAAAAEARQRLQAAERELQEATKRMAETHTQEAAAISSLADITRVQLPIAAGSAATVASLAASHQQQLQQLQGQLQEARLEQQQELQQEAHLKDMSAAVASGLSELETAAAQLSCQAAALQAKAAGAEGLQAAELARAAAAAAEAGGLQAAANTLWRTLPGGGKEQQQQQQTPSLAAATASTTSVGGKETSAALVPATSPSAAANVDADVKTPQRSAAAAWMRGMQTVKAAANTLWRTVPSLERQQQEQQKQQATTAAAGEEATTAEAASKDSASATGSEEVAVAHSPEGNVASPAGGPAGSAAAAEAAHEAVVIEVQPSLPSEPAAEQPAAITTAPPTTTPATTTGNVPQTAAPITLVSTTTHPSTHNPSPTASLGANDDDVSPPPSHDAELAAAAELAHQARLRQDPSLAAAADAAKAQQAVEVAAELGVSEAAARRIVGLPADGSEAQSDTMSAAVPETEPTTTMLTQATPPPPAAAAAKKPVMMVMPLSGVAEEAPWMEAAAAEVAVTASAEQQHAAAPTTPTVTTAAEPGSALLAKPAAASAAVEPLAEQPKALPPAAAAAAAALAPHDVRRSETMMATAGSVQGPDQSTTTADEPGVVQLDVQPKPAKRVTLMLAGPLGGAEDAGAVPVQGVLVGRPSATDQQLEYVLYKTHRQWASHRRRVEAAAAEAQRRQQQQSFHRKGGKVTGSGKWRQMRAWDEPSGYGPSGWTPLAAAGVSDEEGHAGGHIGCAGLPTHAAEGGRSADAAVGGYAAGYDVPRAQQGSGERRQGGVVHSRQHPAAAAAPDGPADYAVRLGAGFDGGDAADAASKVQRWQQSAAPAEEQGLLAGRDTGSRTATTISPGGPISSPEATKAGAPRHKAHNTAPHHHQQQQQQQAPARWVAAPVPAALPHAIEPAAPVQPAAGSSHSTDAAAATAAPTRQAAYSRGADAAAESLMQQWQALPGPLEMGGELPLSR